MMQDTFLISQGISYIAHMYMYILEDKRHVLYCATFHWANKRDVTLCHVRMYIVFRR